MDHTDASLPVMPYGRWISPLSAAAVAAQRAFPFRPIQSGGTLYWAQPVPQEGGRVAIYCADPGRDPRLLLPEPFSVRSRVHEYGGGAFAIADGHLWFVNDADQAIYCLEEGVAPEPYLVDPRRRFADLIWDVPHQRLIAVAEHEQVGGEPRAEIVAIRRNRCEVLQAGRDFYASPRVSSDGRRLAWLSWDHPNMPWNGSELWLSDVTSTGELVQERRIAGSAAESLCQPEFSPDGGLYYISDRSGWWNLHHWDGTCSRNLCPMSADFGFPQWQFDMRSYAILPDGHLLCVFIRDGRRWLGQLNPGTGAFKILDLPWTEYEDIRAGEIGVNFVAASPHEPPVLVDVPVGGIETMRRRQMGEAPLKPTLVSTPEPISFPTEGGASAHGLFYPPRNDEYRAPENTLPPLLVKCHGGPTSRATTAFDPRIQFWTSRGFAVLDVNYRGSTGYGRAYRDALEGQWGVADVADCVEGARFLAENGRVDRRRMVISGSSAGGYTVLCALCFYDIFAAGTSYYGISDLESLTRDTHKFESRYLDRLVGPWPEASDLYRARSPLFQLDGFNRPVLFFQGLKDKVVPPDQAEGLVAALGRRNLDVTYRSFAHEGHGFRRAETTIACLKDELAFYQRVLEL
ncbi:MAG: prolyl oligopeptidase family serine peptidase [Pseudomonadota bacterium]|nr:prolyl oligopeptidase family serine peptidase [Pseudomonadota bacterium]